MYTILHIDSSYFFRNVFDSEFSKYGINYIGAESIKDATDYLKNREDINLILTATEFKDENIEHFIKELSRSKYKNIPIFVITGNEDVKKRIKIFELGIVDYMVKSTPIPNIVDIIIKFTKESELLRNLRKAKVAVLDDSKFEIEKLKSIFLANGIEDVDYFIKEADLLESIENYDIYLIDMVLKEQTGEDIIREIRKNNIYIPIIAVSSIGNSKTIAHVLLSGANDYIIKPYAGQVLLARMEVAYRNYLKYEDCLKKLGEL